MKTTAETAATSPEFESTEAEAELEGKDQKASPISDFNMDVLVGNKTVKEGPASIDDIEIVTVALEEIYTILEKAPELIVSLSSSLAYFLFFVVYVVI